MTPGVRRIAAVILLISMLTAFLIGCWDNRELHTLFIVTGVALDRADSPEQVDLTVQIGKTQAESLGSGDTESQGGSVILLKTTGSTAMEGLMELNRNSNRTLMLQHNQVLLLGKTLAMQGVRDRLDMFMRDRESRMEVLVMVVDGRAEEALSAKLDQDRISGMFLTRVMQDMSYVSSHYKVRMLDFTSRLIDKTTAPIMPIITVVGENDKQEIRISGMAVFKEDRMIGRMSNDEALGYVWSMGNVKRSVVTAGQDSSKVVFQAISLDCKRDVTLRKDGGVRVELSAEATLNIGELSGFGEFTPEELTPYLVALAREEIRKKITDCFETARGLEADIYGFGSSVHRKYPKEWSSMKDRWDELFSDIELSVQVNVRLPAVGQITQNLEMMGSMP